MTRDGNHDVAKHLASLPNVSLVVGETYEEETLQKAFEGVQLAFVNTNGFAIGEKAEIYWGIRMFEIARQHKLEHFVWSNVDYGTRKGNYDPQFRCGHLDGKGKVAGMTIYKSEVIAGLS